MGKITILLVLVPLVAFASIKGCEANSLKKDFYSNSCPQAEKLVKDLVWSKIENNAGLAAKLLRLHFHDCFVRGCDASLTLDNMGDTVAEKNAPPNLSLGGFDVIEYVKAELEKVCPGVVSCADLLALAARDAVSYQFKEPKWEVLTGRRDGNVSSSDEAVANLPSGTDSYDKLVNNFMKVGLDARDLVALSGAHSIGVSFCVSVMDRLNNFTGKGDADPSLDSNYASYLRSKCPNAFAQVPFDNESQYAFDTHYYSNLKQHKGLLTSDAALITNKKGYELVTEMQNPNNFFKDFANSMKKMGAINVLTGTSGNIRKKCNVPN